jgi:transposase
MSREVSPESIVKDIRRKTRKRYSAEEKIRRVPGGLGGEDSISGLCRREGIPTNLHYRWSKDFLEANRPVCPYFRHLLSGKSETSRV